RQIQEALLNWPEVFYLVGIELLTFAIVAFLLSGMGARVPVVAGVILLLLLPATESAVGVMNQLTAFLLPPRLLPKLDLSKGIPRECTTMVVVPTLLINEEHVRRPVCPAEGPVRHNAGLRHATAARDRAPADRHAGAPPQPRCGRSGDQHRGGRLRDSPAQGRDQRPFRRSLAPRQHLLRADGI